MKINAILSLSALFMASVVTAAMPDDPAKIDTCIMPGVVAYTFDDGPGIYNDQLLAILAKKNVKVTFFMLGRMVAQSPAQAASLKKILAAGHMLASHTYTHSNLNNMSEDQMRSEITMTSDVMFQHSGIRPAYMRAPQGNCNDVCRKVMASMNLVVSDWNVDTNDWRHTGLSTQAAVTASMVDINRDIVQNSNPATDSFILLQHEIHKFSVESLTDVVIDAILAKGYRFVTMEECVGKPAYSEGSAPTVPSAPVTPPAASTTAPGVVPPVNPTAAPSAPAGASATTGAPVPSAPSAASATPTIGSSTATGNKKQESSAGMVKVGAWAMGVAAIVGYALF